MAFMSYARFDDDYEDGKLTRFRERLSSEVRLQSGQDFPIFQDHADIKAGQDWKQRIGESLDGAKFLNAVITPSFFRSEFCRYELQRFFEREQRLGRNDLIFPIYYVNCPFLHDETRLAQDELAKKLMTRQFTDWRELRHEPLTSPQAGRMLEKLAIQIRDAIERAPSHGTATRQEPLSERTGGAEKAARVDERSSTASENYENGQGLLEDNDIFGNAHPGAQIKTGGNPALRGNRIYDGKAPGVLVWENGQGLLEDNDIFGNALAGVQIRTGGNPTLRSNRIHDGKQSGVFVWENGQGLLEDNDIFGNAHSGVQTKTGGNPTVRKNRIHDGKAGGVYVYENGQGLLEDNDIFVNALSGIKIETGGNPTVRKNRINRNAYHAVYIHDEGHGIIEDNDLRDNAEGAWLISADNKGNVKRARNVE